MKFSKELSAIEIDDNEGLVSFDVVSLFTAIPVDKASEYIKKELEQDATLSSRTNLDIDDITALLQFALSNNYFVFNDRIYKQVHGCAMGSPVSSLWPIFAWRRSKSPQPVIYSSVPPKFGKGTLTIVFASLEKTMSQPSMTH